MKIGRAFTIPQEVSVALDAAAQSEGKPVSVLVSEILAKVLTSELVRENAELLRCGLGRMAGKNSDKIYCQYCSRANVNGLETHGEWRLLSLEQGVEHFEKFHSK